MTQTTRSTEERYLTTKEVGELLNISKATAVRHIKSGVIPSIKIGRAVRIPAGELEQRLQRMARKQAEV